MVQRAHSAISGAPAAGILVSGFFFLLSFGCTEAKPGQRLNAPPQGSWDKRPDWAKVFAYHNDQALMADMSLADFHFIPHSARLSGTGEARLERYAELLATSGGTIRYDAAVRDEGLIDARLETASQFLAQAVPGAEEIDVVLGLAGGRGMVAKEAIAGKDVAKQPEKRAAAYKLNVPTAGDEGG